jgi:hypothetical protein
MNVPAMQDATTELIVLRIIATWENVHLFLTTLNAPTQNRTV